MDVGSQASLGCVCTEDVINESWEVGGGGFALQTSKRGVLVSHTFQLSLQHGPYSPLLPLPLNAVLIFTSSTTIE